MRRHNYDVRGCVVETQADVVERSYGADRHPVGVPDSSRPPERNGFEGQRPSTCSPCPRGQEEPVAEDHHFSKEIFRLLKHRRRLSGAQMKSLGSLRFSSGDRAQEADINRVQNHLNGKLPMSALRRVCSAI